MALRLIPAIERGKIDLQQSRGATIARTCVGIRRRQWPVSDRLYVQAIGIGQTEA